MVTAAPLCAVVLHAASLADAGHLPSLLAFVRSLRLAAQPPPPLPAPLVVVASSLPPGADDAATAVVAACSPPQGDTASLECVVLLLDEAHAVSQLEAAVGHRRDVCAAAGTPAPGWVVSALSYCISSSRIHIFGPTPSHTPLPFRLAFPLALAPRGGVAACCVLTATRADALLASGLLHPMPRGDLVTLLLPLSSASDVDGDDNSADAAALSACVRVLRLRGDGVVILHKPTDELVPAPPPAHADQAERLSVGYGFHPRVAARAAAASAARARLVDAPSSLRPVVDRFAAYELVARMEAEMVDSAGGGRGGATPRLAAPRTTAPIASLGAGDIERACAGASPPPLLYFLLSCWAKPKIFKVIFSHPIFFVLTLSSPPPHHSRGRGSPAVAQAPGRLRRPGVPRLCFPPLLRLRNIPPPKLRSAAMRRPRVCTRVAFHRQQRACRQRCAQNIRVRRFAAARFHPPRPA